MSVHYRMIQGDCVIVGHTYPHREALRLLGAQFDRELKAWRVSASSVAAVEQFCSERGGGRLGSPPLPAQPRTIVVETKVEVPTLRLAELVQQVQLKISQGFPQSLWIVGEIHNLQKRGKGIYLQLAEPKNAESQGTISIAATLWNQVWNRLKTNPEIERILQNDSEVRVLVQVGFYKDRGQLSLNILDVDPKYSLGLMALHRQRLLAELRQLGLDQKNKKQVLTRFPMRIGLISAAESRAQSDFLDQLASYDYPGTVVFLDARMQGEQAIDSILDALEQMRDAGCDMVILTRGGGSQADLRWFDDKRLALAIAHFPAPLIAAIGHHDDVSVAEEVAFRREKTPTAAADFVITWLAQTLRSIEHQQAQVVQLSELWIRRCEKQFDELRFRWLQSIEMMFLRAEKTWSEILVRLQRSAHTALERGYRWTEERRHEIARRAQDWIFRAQMQLEKFTQVLIKSDPQPWMDQGWTQLSTDQKPIRHAEQIHVGQNLRARLRDAGLELQVTSIHPIEGKK